MRVLLLHASRAAVEPVAVFFAARGAELGFDTINIFDDGIMPHLDAGNQFWFERRFLDLIAGAVAEYGVSMAMLTCSAVPADSMDRIRAGAAIPVFKIDEPMAKQAAATGRRIGVLATFPATCATTRGLLLAAQPDSEIYEELDTAALQALLAGDVARHDELFLAAADRLAASKPEVVVLAQVSMARLHKEVVLRCGCPVFNSLETSLGEIQRLQGI